MNLNHLGTMIEVDAIPMFYWKVKDLSGDLQMFHLGPTMPTGGHINGQ